MKKLVVMSHPLIDHKMAKIRDKNTHPKEFRESVSEIGALLTYEVTRDLETEATTVETPLGLADCKVLSKSVVLVPILRAGLGMVDGIHNLIPTAKIGHVGLYRDEETLEPHIYYAKFPVGIKDSLVIILDPMLATGGTVSKTVDILKERGVKKIKYVGIVGCPEGVARLQNDHPDVPIYLAALDSHLNDVGYIYPGLGDCGDRLFGTK
jgi:uracil phosphoribosyltransferase